MISRLLAAGLMSITDLYEHNNDVDFDLSNSLSNLALTSNLNDLRVVTVSSMTSLNQWNIDINEY